MAELRLTSVEPAAPARIVTPRPPDVVTGAIPDEVPTRLNWGVLLRLTAVLAEIVPATMVTARPPDVVTGAIPPDVPTIWTSVLPAPAPETMVTSRPPDVVTVAIPLDDPTRLIAVLPDAAPPRIVTPRPPDVVTGATPDDVPTILTSGVPLICRAPDDAETNGMLKLGAEDQGFVAAVAVTVGTDDSVTVPLEMAIAELRDTSVEPAAPARMVTPRPPEVVTGATPDDVPTRLTSGVPLIWSKPLDALTNGMLNPGALLHGLVAAVAVTVWTLLSVTVPDVRALRAVPPDEATMTSGALDSVTVPDDREITDDRLTAVVGLVIVTAVLGLVTWISNPPDDVTGAIAVVLNEPTVNVCLC